MCPNTPTTKGRTTFERIAKIKKVARGDEYVVRAEWPGLDADEGTRELVSGILGHAPAVSRAAFESYEVCAGGQAGVEEAVSGEICRFRLVWRSAFFLFFVGIFVSYRVTTSSFFPRCDFLYFVSCRRCLGVLLACSRLLVFLHCPEISRDFLD